MMDDGICSICELHNTASLGDQPKFALKKIESFYYEERKIGIQRIYFAKKENEKVDLLISIWQDRKISPSHICMIQGVQYRINTIQHDEDEDGQKITILTLEQLDKNYELI